MIIPAYNEAQRIGACLDSIREALEYAEVTDAEVIVVDDESGDDTSDVARAHGAVAIRQSRRRGPLAAWSRGVAGQLSVPGVSSSTPIAGLTRQHSPRCWRLSRDPTVGVVAARSELDSRRTGNSMVERSAAFSALMLHETKSRLDNHEFLPIGRADGGAPGGVAGR